MDLTTVSTGVQKRKLKRRAVIAPHGDRLSQRAGGVRAALDTDPEALRRQQLTALQVKIGVGELVHGAGSRGVGCGEQPRQLPAEPQLVLA